MPGPSAGQGRQPQQHVWNTLDSKPRATFGMTACLQIRAREQCIRAVKGGPLENSNVVMVLLLGVLLMALVVFLGILSVSLAGSLG